MEIFPYIILRIGGAPFDIIETLNVVSDNSFKDIFNKKNQLKNEISTILFNKISELKDVKKQNILLGFKRDLFNERNIKNLLISNFENEIDSNSLFRIKCYLDILRQIDLLTMEITDKYELEMPLLRDKLKQLSLEHCIQNGLVFSSQSLFKNVEEYNKYSGEYTKSIKKTEVSIIKYLTRTAAKTSPFSSFNNLALGKLCENIGNELLTNCDRNLDIKSEIRINNNIFAYVKNSIFKLNNLYKYFHIIPNPTITVQEDQFNYLINFNNVESFQKIKINPIIEYFLSVLKDNGRITYTEFVNKVVKDEILEAGEDEIGDYVYKLIELGFFEFDINISGLDTDWVNKLIFFLKKLPCESESRDIIVETLSYLCDMVPKFKNADIDERLILSKKSADKFLEMKVHFDNLLKPKEDKKEGDESKEKEHQNEEKESGKEKEKPIIKNIQFYNLDIKPESVFYEDTVIDGEFCLDSHIFKKIMQELQNFLNYFCIFEIRRDEQDTMSDFFINKYGETESVKLLTFYEDYISLKKERDLKAKKEKEKKEKENKKESGKINDNKYQKETVNYIEDSENELIPVIKDRREIHKRWFESIKEILSKENISSDADVNITDKVLMESFRSAGIEKSSLKNNSMGFFLQFYRQKNHHRENEIKAVLNTTFPGYGKMTSRFLHLFPDKVTNETRKWNYKFSEDSIIAENIDSGIMNFNLHPDLMPYEISIPGGNFVLKTENRIPISRLIVNFNKDERCLQLVDEELKKRVYAFDLGFQGYGGRSELFKFLENFTLSKLIFPHTLVGKINELIKPQIKYFNGNKGFINVFPRIYYNDKILIARKKWIIPKSLLPIKNQTEKESEYFAKLKRWCGEMGLPDEVFVKYNSQTTPVTDKVKQKKYFSRDDYKPQYINFNNPFLVRLFEKNLEKVIDTLKISEMMPGSDQLLMIDNKKYVSEFVVQNYNFK
jgi:hypothetical protein